MYVPKADEEQRSSFEHVSEVSSVRHVRAHARRSSDPAQQRVQGALHVHAAAWAGLAAAALGAQLQLLPLAVSVLLRRQSLLLVHLVHILRLGRRAQP